MLFKLKPSITFNLKMIPWYTLLHSEVDCPHTRRRHFRPMVFLFQCSYEWKQHPQPQTQDSTATPLRNKRSCTSHTSTECQSPSKLRAWQRMGVRAIFKWLGTLRQALVRRSPTPELKKKDVIYRVPSMDCNIVYIGETSRCLETDRTQKEQWRGVTERIALPPLYGTRTAGWTGRKPRSSRLNLTIGRGEHLKQSGFRATATATTWTVASHWIRSGCHCLTLS